MKIKFFILIILSFITKLYGEKLSARACLLVKNVLKNEPWMKTISVVEFQADAKNDMTENLHKCLPIDVTKVLMEVKDKKRFDDMRIHSPGLNVLIFNRIHTNHELKLKMYRVSFPFIITLNSILKKL